MDNESNITHPTDWKSYYTELRNQLHGEDEDYPYLEEVEETGSHQFFRGPVFEICDKQRTHGITTFAFCDVALLRSKTIDFSPGEGGLMVFARTISAEDPCAINVKIASESIAHLRLCIFNVSQKLTVTFSDPDRDWTSPEQTLNPNQHGTILVHLIYKDNHVTVESPPVEQHRFPLHYDIARRFVQSQCRIATLTSYTIPSLSTQILQFVRFLDPEHESFRQVSEPLEQARHTVNIGTPYLVSPLSLKACDSAVKRSLDAARSSRAELERFVDKYDPAQRLEEAQAANNEMRSSIAEQDALLPQARDRKINAKAAQEEAHSHVLISWNAIEKEAREFANQVEAWAKRRRNDIKAKALLACLGLVASVAGIAVGHGNGLPEIPKLVHDIADFTENLDKLHDAEAQYVDLMTTVNACRFLHKALRVLHAEADEKTENQKGVRTRKRDVDPDRRNAITAWQVFGLDLSSRLQLVGYLAISDNVPSARKYHFAINRHVEWEKNQCETTLQFLEARQLYRQAEERKIDLEAKRQETERVLKSLKGKKVEFKSRCAVLFDRSLAMQNDVIRRLRDYWDSYRYCTLRHVQLNLDVAKPLAHLQKCYDNIHDDYLRFLLSRTIPPSPFSKDWTLKDLELSFPQVKTALAAVGHQFSFELSTSFPGPFKDLRHTHLSSLEVWLDGARPILTEVGSVILQVETSGIYQNVNVDGEWLTFKTQPLTNAFFVYPVRLQDCPAGPPEMPLEFGEPCIQPTPFTRWTITLVNPDYVDLSSLSAIRFRCRGTTYHKDMR
ncbi:hypothetical protein F5887DRAFT_1073532 [Amanita rubescens]|nr:hypothetical protein F5887DRAFT_1073532 [Amanita rubescens]